MKRHHAALSVAADRRVRRFNCYRGIIRTGNRGTHVSYQSSEASRFSDLPKVAKVAGLVAAIALVYGIATRLPIASIGENEIGLRLNRMTGSTTELGEGAALVVPGLHRLRALPRSLPHRCDHRRAQAYAHRHRRGLQRLRALHAGLPGGLHRAR